MDVKTKNKDRHRPGYYKEYAKKTKKKDRHRPGYYTEYNKKHPERLNRGYTKGYVNGNVSEGLIMEQRPEIAPGVYLLGWDEFGLPITNDPIGDMLRRKETEWHDDDWCEDVD